MKICDSFITTIEKGNKHRDYCYQLTKQALCYCGLVPLTIRAPLLTRYLAAENSAKTDYYILSDDDVIPMHPDTMINILEAIKSKPEIGMLGLAYQRLLRKNDLGNKFKSDLGGGIYETESVKGIRVIKKGILPIDKSDWEDLRNDYWERLTNKSISDNIVVAEMIRNKGYKVALDTNNYFWHIGEGYTTLLEERFNTYEVFK